MCDTRYNPMHARLLGEEDDTHLMHVTCKKCQNSILAVVVTSQGNASSIGLVTDLSYEDVMRVGPASAVTVDDVIDVHEFLESGAWKTLHVPKKKTIHRKPVHKAKARSSKKSK